MKLLRDIFDGMGPPGQEADDFQAVRVGKGLEQAECVPVDFSGHIITFDLFR